MNPRTLRRHRERERMGLPVPGYRKDAKGKPLPKLGRPAGETAQARDALALEFCEAVFACLEEGVVPVLEALRQYPRHPAPPGPPVWRKSPEVRKRIEAAGLPAQVLLVALWDSMPSLMVAEFRGIRSAKGRAGLKSWAKGRTAEGRAAARDAASKGEEESKGFFGEETRAALEALGDAMVAGFADHASTRFARQVADSPVVPRKHRGAGAVLAMSRRMVCHYRARPEYETAIALIEGFKRRARSKFVARGVAAGVDAGGFAEETIEIDFEAMDARLARR